MPPRLQFPLHKRPVPAGKTRVSGCSRNPLRHPLRVPYDYTCQYKQSRPAAGSTGQLLEPAEMTVFRSFSPKVVAGVRIPTGRGAGGLVRGLPGCLPFGPGRGLARGSIRGLTGCGIESDTGCVQGRGRGCPSHCLEQCPAGRLSRRSQRSLPDCLIRCLPHCGPDCPTGCLIHCLLRCLSDCGRLKTWDSGAVEKPRRTSL